MWKYCYWSVGWWVTVILFYIKLGQRPSFRSRLRCAQITCLLFTAWPGFLLLAWTEAKSSMKNVQPFSLFPPFANLIALLTSLLKFSAACTFSSFQVQNSSGGVWQWVVYCFGISAELDVRLVVCCVSFRMRAAFLRSNDFSKPFSWWAIYCLAFAFLAVVVDSICLSRFSYSGWYSCLPATFHFLYHQDCSLAFLSSDWFRKYLKRAELPFSSLAHESKIIYSKFSNAASISVCRSLASVLEMRCGRDLANICSALSVQCGFNLWLNAIFASLQKSRKAYCFWTVSGLWWLCPSQLPIGTDASPRLVPLCIIKSALLLPLIARHVCSFATVIFHPL